MTDVVMPQMGLSMTEGAVTSWVKQIGEHVEKGEILFTVQTDKVEIEIESASTGYLKETLVELGQTVAVGTVIARLSEQPVAS